MSRFHKVVALADLDNRLKAIVKMKIREFVHLSPCFHDLPAPDPIQFTFSATPNLPIRRHFGNCPNYRHRAIRRHRAVSRTRA
jgi:hypothetical protein